MPPWSKWWGEDAMHALVPNPQVRQRIEAELPELPLDYFEEAIPVPDAWDSVPVAYIRFSDAYEAEAQEAGRRGYAVEHVPGGHLHAVVEPATVAKRIVEVAERLVGGPS